MFTEGVNASKQPHISLCPTNTQSQLANQCALAIPSRSHRNPISSMHALSGVVAGAPTVVNAVCTHIGLKNLSFVVGGAFAACLLCLPCASLVSSSVLCFLVVVGWSGFVKAINFESIKIAHTCWQTSFFIFCILCIDISLGHTTPPLELTLAHPPRVVLRYTEWSPVHTGTPTVGLEPTTTRLRALRSTD